MQYAPSIIYIPFLSSFLSLSHSPFAVHLPSVLHNNNNKAVTDMMQNLTERLRPLVGFNGWDYCVSWKLSEDQRFLEWLGCCCGGSESNGGGEEYVFPVCSCRDTMFPHPRTNSCNLLSQLTTSISIMDSGIHAQTLLTNQPSWLNYSNTFNPNIMEESIGTQVLIPVAGGVVELFVTKQVAEDEQVIDFITAQCIALVEHEEDESNSPLHPLNYKKRGKNEGVSEQKEKEKEKDSNWMSDCSEEEEEGKYRRRNGKGNQSKNLVAERRRRKKLNDRLYNLRSLVPNISKLDRASILGDAIEYVKDLEKEVKELQEELEENNNNNSDTNTGGGGGESNWCVVSNKGKEEEEEMEAQVEVAVIEEGSEYYVKVFSEQRRGGFVRLMEAFNSIGMDVLHATVTTHKGLVSNVFKLHNNNNNNKNDEMLLLQPQHLRDSLLQLTSTRSNSAV